MADFNYPLQYRPFESLLEEVRVDFKNFALEGRIEPQQLIKIALRVNYDLGLRIHQSKGAVVEVEHGKGKLPNDFYIMNYALLCGEFTVHEIPGQGTNIQEIDGQQIIDNLLPSYKYVPPDNSCAPITVNNSPLPCLSQCGTDFALIRKVNTITRTYKHLRQLRFTSSKDVDCNCPNLNWVAQDEAYIKNGYLYTSFECADVYINYEGNLEDSDGNMLVPDHQGLNAYYEYALKEKILETLLMEGEGQTVTNMLQYIVPKLKESRRIAKSIVNTPNFSEMQQLWNLNRRAMAQKYYQMFSSFPYRDNYDYRNVI